jgi:hypothetical protein
VKIESSLRKISIRKPRSSIVGDAAGQAFAVLALVVVAERAGVDGLPPPAVLLIPADGSLEGGKEVVLGGPAQGPQLRRIDSVAAIVPLAVLHEADETQGLLQELEEGLRHPDVLLVVVGTDVVHLPRLADPGDELQGAAVVLHVQPVTHLAAVAVQGERLVPHGAGDEQGHHLLHVLAGTDVVGRAGDDHGQSVGLEEGDALSVAAGLASGVGAAGVEGIALAGVDPGLHLPVHLIRGHLNKTAHVGMAAGRFQQDVGPENIGEDEGAGLHERAVHVRLGGKVEHHVHLRHELVHQGGITDVAPHEPVVGVLFHVPQVGGVAGVGELVQVDHLAALIAIQQVEDEVAADEAAAAGDQNTRVLEHL